MKHQNQFFRYKLVQITQLLFGLRTAYNQYFTHMLVNGNNNNYTTIVLLENINHYATIYTKVKNKGK